MERITSHEEIPYTLMVKSNLENGNNIKTYYNEKEIR